MPHVDDDFIVHSFVSSSTPVFNFGRMSEISEAEGSEYDGRASLAQTPANSHHSSYRHSMRMSALRASDSRSCASSISKHGKDVFIRGTLLDRDIEATIVPYQKPERPQDYKGRIRVRCVFLIIIRIYCIAIRIPKNKRKSGTKN